MSTTYRVGIVGCGRMGGSIDDEVLDYPACILPYSHAAAYTSLPNTTIVAAADISETALERFCTRWSVPKRYTDYREMIEQERPDIVSVTTHGITHAEITIFAAEHGAKGIYCEKAMCSSMVEADRMVEACERNGVAFNIGTLRRYHPGYEMARRLIEEERIGEPKAAIAMNRGTLLHTHSHTFDTMCYLLGDPEVEYVQGRLEPGDYDITQNRFDVDPVGVGYIRFKNGLDAHVVGAPGFYEFTVLGTKGEIRVMNNGIDWGLRVKEEGQKWHIFKEGPFPAFEQKSPTVRCVEDLIGAMETGRRSLGNVHIARAVQEIALGFAESHRQGGARIPMPLQNKELYIASR